PPATYESYWGFDGLQETATLHLDQTLDWESGHHLSTALNTQIEGLRTPFAIAPGVIVPPGRYVNPFFFAQGNTDRKRWISGDMSWQYGDFLSGDQHAVAPAVTVRQGSMLVAALRWTHADVTLPQGRFTTNLSSLKVTYNI